MKSDTGKKAVRIGILFLLRFAFNRKRQTGDWLGRRTRNLEIARLSPASSSPAVITRRCCSPKSRVQLHGRASGACKKPAVDLHQLRLLCSLTLFVSLIVFVVVVSTGPEETYRGVVN